MKDEKPRKPLTQPVEDKRKFLQRPDKPSRNEAWSSKQEESDDSPGSRKGLKGLLSSLFSHLVATERERRLRLLLQRLFKQKEVTMSETTCMMIAK